MNGPEGIDFRYKIINKNLHIQENINEKSTNYRKLRE